MNNRTQLKNGDPGFQHQAKVGKTLKTSTPWWRERLRPPEGAPNIVVILLDDLGFSDLGCYGSEIRTPHIDALARGGLQFTGYTTVPMCTPARAALMTGKNPHSVGCGWLTHANPGYPGYQAGEISQDAPTLSELLRANGYATYGVGKWHNTADSNVVPGGDRSAWPLQRGFDRFYGFLGAETNSFSPGQLIEGNEFLNIDAYPDGYYTTRDWTDRAISNLRSHRAGGSEKPFFLYMAHNAPHVPLQAPADIIASYDGMYDAGWEAVREQRYLRQKQMGVIPGDWRLPTINPGVPRWEDIPAEQRPIMAHYMQLFAAMVSLIDDSVGRVVAELKAQGVFDNTLIVLTSDNGASSIGGPEGAVNILEKRVTQVEPAGLAQELLAAGELGGVDSYAAYPVGWGNCGNTPFRFYKRTPMNGGIRVPFITSYPRAIKDPGSRRDQWIHVTDTLPTLLDLLGTEYPAEFKGYATRQLDGSSYFDLLKDASCKSSRTVQHFELEGNRGYIRWPWKIASLQPPGTEIDLDRWLLFNLADDPTECEDLAKIHPEVLADLVTAFEHDATANYVYPLDNRAPRRVLAMPPFMAKAFNSPRTFYPGTETITPYAFAPLIADRNYQLTCEFNWAPGMQGVLFAAGDNTSGIGAYVIDAHVHLVYASGRGKQRRVKLPVTEGEQKLFIDHVALGKRQGSATVSLLGQSTAQELDMSPTFLRIAGEGLDIGRDRKRKVCPEYADRGVFAYPGLIKQVHVVPGLQATDSLANRPEALSQID